MFHIADINILTNRTDEIFSEALSKKLENRKKSRQTGIMWMTCEIWFFGGSRCVEEITNIEEGKVIFGKIKCYKKQVQNKKK